MNFPAVHRMWWLMQQGLREVVQQRYTWMLGGTALLMMGGASVLREFNFGAEEGRFLRDFAEATLALWGTILAIMLNLALVQGGVEHGSLVMTFMRGVRRHEWLLSRWAAISVAVAWLVLLGYLMLGALLAWHGHAVPRAELAVAGGRMFLRLWLVSSFALTACAASRSLMVAGALALGLTLAAQLSSILQWAGRHSGASARWGWHLLDWLVPAFRALDTDANALHALVYAIGYSGLYVLLSCALFSRRDI